MKDNKMCLKSAKKTLSCTISAAMLPSQCELWNLSSGWYGSRNVYATGYSTLESKQFL